MHNPDLDHETTRPFMYRHLASLLLLAVFSSISQSREVADTRHLSFLHTHTQERISITYFEDGQYRHEALKEFNHFLRDFRNNETTEMDPAVFDILFDIQQRSGSTGVYEVISAYRSESTNEMLRSRSSGVAKNSQHMHGKAIDVRLSDLDTTELRDVALSLQRGGVGYYRDSDFVHVDTGRVRQW